LLAERAGNLRGFLACLMNRPPRAALAAAGLVDDWAVAGWLELLLPPCVERLRAQEAASLAYVGTASWLIDALLTRGFQFVSNIVAYERTDDVAPAGGNRSVRLRPVRPSDLAALAALDALNFHPLWRNSEGALARWRATLPFFVVALVEEEPVGYCTCSIQGEHGHLIRMAVHPAWQGQGIGTRLVAEAVQFFERAGVELITLNTQEENERAQRLYRKFGFRPMGRGAVALWWDIGG
jgi:GNAT superfamily N-acetyltransferase